MIYGEPQDVRPLHLPQWSLLIASGWAQVDSPAGRLIDERGRLLAQLAPIDERAAKRREEVQAELTQARQAATVTAGSSPADLALATAVAGSAPAILAQIEAEARQESDAIKRQLARAEHNLQRLLTPLVHMASLYSKRAAEYEQEVAMLRRSGGDHGASLAAHEILGMVAANAAFFARTFQQVAGRPYENQWGPIYR